eukprot:jgi/Astpho2/8515/Aster-x1528
MFDWIAVLVMIILLVLTEMSQPFSKVIYHQTDQELWRLSYPLHTKNTVPAWAVPVLSTCGPALVFTIWYFAAKPSRWEMHSIALGLLANVMACALVTNVIKLSVGRPRPNFVERCWPDGKLQFDTAGVPLCAANAINPAEGRKSFPSGHTSWTTSGMAYLSFWAAGKLRCFNGGGHPWRLVVSGAPTGLAATTGITGRHQRTLTGSCRATSLAASATVIIDDFCLSSDVAVFADTFIDFCLSTGLPPLNDTFMEGCLASDPFTSPACFAEPCRPAARSLVAAAALRAPREAAGESAGASSSSSSSTSSARSWQSLQRGLPGVQLGMTANPFSQCKLRSSLPDPQRQALEALHHHRNAVLLHACLKNALRALPGL